MQSSTSGPKRLRLKHLTLAIAAGFGAVAWAQGVKPATDADAGQSATLERVEVTVQRRKEKLQDVPVAATAITSRATAKIGESNRIIAPNTSQSGTACSGVPSGQANLPPPTNPPSTRD